MQINDNPSTLKDARDLQHLCIDKLLKCYPEVYNNLDLSNAMKRVGHYFERLEKHIDAMASRNMELERRIDLLLGMLGTSSK